MSLTKKILENSTEIRSEPGPPQVFKLRVAPKVFDGGKDVIMCEVGKNDTVDMEHRQRVVMVVGATGAGKTTLINGMANYLFGVEWKDNFRFKLVADDEEGGKDQAVNDYNKTDNSVLLPKADWLKSSLCLDHH